MLCSYFWLKLFIYCYCITIAFLSHAAMPGFGLSSLWTSETIAIDGELYEGTVITESRPKGLIYSQGFTEMPIGGNIPMPINYITYALDDIDLTIESEIDPETGKPPIGKAMRTCPTLYVGPFIVVIFLYVVFAIVLCCFIVI